MTERVEKTDAEWQAELDPDRYQVLRCGATEAPWSGELNLVHDDGMFRAAPVVPSSSARTRSSTPAPAGRASSRRSTRKRSRSRRT